MRYYCHNCHIQINADELLPEFTCPSCHSGFIEEIPVAGSRRNSNLDESTRSGSEDGLSSFIPGPTRMSSDEYSDDNSDVEFLDAYNSPLAQVFGLLTQQQQQQQHQQQSSTPVTTAGQSSQQQQSDADSSDTTGNNSAHPNFRSVQRAFHRNHTPGQMHTAYSPQSPSQSLSDVLNEFIAGVSFGTQYPESQSSGSGQNAQGASGSGSITANRGLINIDFPLPFFLHSNPGDYAWGNAGFDAVITQLLNNLDGSNSGPPPMPKDQVENLPTVKISDGQVKKSNLQCTVCMEDFQVGDSARQLPCEHFFHQDCIVPWLNLVSICTIILITQS